MPIQWIFTIILLAATFVGRDDRANVFHAQVRMQQQWHFQKIPGKPAQRDCWLLLKFTQRHHELSFSIDAIKMIYGNTRVIDTLLENEQKILLNTPYFKSFVGCRFTGKLDRRNNVDSFQGMSDLARRIREIEHPRYYGEDVSAPQHQFRSIMRLGGFRVPAGAETWEDQVEEFFLFPFKRTVTYAIKRANENEILIAGVSKMSFAPLPDEKGSPVKNCRILPSFAAGTEEATYDEKNKRIRACASTLGIKGIEEFEVDGKKHRGSFTMMQKIDFESFDRKPAQWKAPRAEEP